VSLLLAGRLSINVRADPEQKVSGFLSRSVESGEGTPIALTSHVYLLSMAAAYLNQTFTGRIPPASPVSKSPMLSCIEGKRVKITGRIELYKGKPEIRIDVASQLEIE
jgi:hypothetical protein